MKILYVVNNAFSDGNGLSASCRHTVQYLKKAGEDVRILSGCGKDGEQPDYALSDEHIPVFDGLIRKQGYTFAEIDRETVAEAVRWADIVHLEEPFLLQAYVCVIARQEHTPLTATYHLHPENLFSSVHLRKSIFFNWNTMAIWRDAVYNHCRVIQCPTENVRRRLKRWHYRPELRVISNGMIPAVTETVPSPIKKEPDTFLLVLTGRYSYEKDQSTLLRAMRFSKYADRIQLVFAGRGPTESKLRRKAEALCRKGVINREPQFGCYNAAQLQAIYRQADLYIHCATIEVEGLSCMEAIQTGLVPVIAEGRLTATSQFALSTESRFPAKNARALARRIDYWLEDEERRRQEAERYCGLETKYSITDSVEALRRMYRDAACCDQGRQYNGEK